MSTVELNNTLNKLLDEVSDVKAMIEALKMQVTGIEFKFEQNLVETTRTDAPKRATRSRKPPTVEEGEEVVEKKKRAPAKKKEAKKKEIVEDEDVDADEVVLTDTKKKRAPAKKKEGKKRQTKAEKEAAALAASLVDAQASVNEDS